MKPILLLAATMGMSVLSALPAALSRPVTIRQAGQDSAKPSATSHGNECRIAGESVLNITCDYPSPQNRSAPGELQIVLNHATFWFKTNDESRLKVALTFTHLGTGTIKDARTVYLAIDRADGQNFVRRDLPHVNLQQLENKPVTFSDTFLSPALRRGQYAIHLWIPSPDPSLKFDRAHNLLLSNPGIADEKTGLNTLVTFSVTESPGR